MSETKNIGIPESAILKFHEFHQNIQDVINDLVGNLCVRGGVSNIETISLIFEIIGCMEVSALFSAGDALNNINGEITNIQFEGVKCLKCDRPKCPSKH